MIINPAFALVCISLLNSTRNETFQHHKQMKRSLVFQNTIGSGGHFNYNNEKNIDLKPLDVLNFKKSETESCLENLNFYKSNFKNRDVELEIYRPGFLQKCDKIIKEYLLSDKNIASSFKTVVFNNMSGFGSPYEYYH